MEYSGISIRHTLARLKVGLPTIQELKTAEYNLVRFVQQEAYYPTGEGKDPRKVLTRDNQLKRLNPIVVNDLICVNGRVTYPEDARPRTYPAILPKAHRITELLIEHYHKVEGHSGSS